MLPIEFIRRRVLKMTQVEFAECAKVAQPTVSRWEAGELVPDQEEMARIRAAVIALGRRWNDRWFFEVPADQDFAGNKPRGKRG